MIRRLIVVLTVLAAQLAFVAVVLAGTQGSCLPSDLEKVQAYENKIGDTQDGNDTLWACTNISNLTGVNHSLPTDCAAFIIGETNWGNCISSVRPYIVLGRSFCIYSLTSYHGIINRFEHATNGIRVNLSQNDAALSFRWVAATASC